MSDSDSSSSLPFRILWLKIPLTGPSTAADLQTAAREDVADASWPLIPAEAPRAWAADGDVAHTAPPDVPRGPQSLLPTPRTLHVSRVEAVRGIRMALAADRPIHTLASPPTVRFGTAPPHVGDVRRDVGPIGAITTPPSPPTVP